MYTSLMSSCKFMLSCGNPFVMQKQRTSILFSDDKVNLGEFMSAFSQRQKVYCGLPATNGVCAIHKCGLPECYEPVKNMDHYYFHDQDQSNYCDKHTCNSGNICWNLCVDGSYCSEHKCANCRNEAMGETHLCKEHLTKIKCSADGCSNYIKLEPYVEGEFVSQYHYCSEHTCHNCKKKHKLTGGEYCYSCNCDFKECHNLKDAKSCYCVEHSKQVCHYGKIVKCKALQCENSTYCSAHKCSFQGCINHIYEYNDEDGGYISCYCYHHDSLDKLCKKYRFTLDDSNIRDMIDNCATQYEILPTISNTSTFDELTDHMMFSIAILAEKKCVKSEKFV